MSKTAKLELDSKTYSLPVVVGSEGEHGIDISALRQTTGHITLDDGYSNTGSCSSHITFIDGDNGILRYRGYPIEELAEKSTYLETAYLIIFSELPTRKQLEEWTYHVTHHTFIHESIKKFLDGFHYDAHPMGMLIS